MSKQAQFVAAGLGALTWLAAAPAFAISGPFNQTYPASEVALDHLVGRIEIAVGGSTVVVSISGQADELEAVTVTSSGAVLTITSSKRHRDLDDDGQGLATYKLTVPKGTKLSADHIIGEAKIGDIAGDIKVSGAALTAEIGLTKSADLRLAGSGHIKIADVAGALGAKIAGSGAIEAQNADSADASIAGSGTITLRDLKQGLAAAISGNGDITAASINGPLKVAIAGSGRVKIAAGRANPLKLSIMGSGELDFGGTAVDPEIAVMGSGDVKLGAYTGKLSSRGNPNLTIGK